MDDHTLPTELWLDARLRALNAAGISYYIIRRGAYASGIVLLKINGLNGACRLLIQQRNFTTDKLEWAAALKEEIVAEGEADAYVARAVARDPDLWVIEIEDRGMSNPFLD